MESLIDAFPSPRLWDQEHLWAMGCGDDLGLDVTVAQLLVGKHGELLLWPGVVIGPEERQNGSSNYLSRPGGQA